MGVLRGIFLEKKELMLHWDLCKWKKIPGFDFTVLWDHEDIIESESQRNFFRAKNALIDFVLFFEIGDSLLDLLGLKTFGLGLQIDFVHFFISKLIINTPSNLDKNWKSSKINLEDPERYFKKPKHTISWIFSETNETLRRI